MHDNINTDGRNIKEEILQGVNLKKAQDDCKNNKGVVTFTNHGASGNKKYDWAVKTDKWE